METPPLSVDDRGCWIDGHWGHYGDARLIQIAEHQGWKAYDALLLANIYFDNDGDVSNEDFEILIAYADEALDWLNENRAPEGFSFGWHDGEMFLWTDEEWEDEF